MKRFHLRLDAILRSEAAIVLQLFPVVDSVKLDRRIIGVRLETLVVGVEADRHHVRLLLHQFDPLREAAIGNSVLNDRLDLGRDKVL
jgi:hypothetical protein